MIKRETCLLAANYFVKYHLQNVKIYLHTVKKCDRIKKLFYNDRYGQRSPILDNSSDYSWLAIRKEY